MVRRLQMALPSDVAAAANSASEAATVAELYASFSSAAISLRVSLSLDINTRVAINYLMDMDVMMQRVEVALTNCPALRTIPQVSQVKDVLDGLTSTRDWPSDIRWAVASLIFQCSFPTCPNESKDKKHVLKCLGVREPNIVCRSENLHGSTGELIAPNMCIVVACDIDFGKQHIYLLKVDEQEKYI
ncbi:hypothetical protein L7F22_059230 [Adiantum nelumboides]|nr:hypothetical protein [Adiantum nelumboides]